MANNDAVSTSGLELHAWGVMAQRPLALMGSILGTVAVAAQIPHPGRARWTANTFGEGAPAHQPPEAFLVAVNMSNQIWRWAWSCSVIAVSVRCRTGERVGMRVGSPCRAWCGRINCPGQLPSRRGHR
jgi:hypothetical protein